MGDFKSYTANKDRGSKRSDRRGSSSNRNNFRRSGGRDSRDEGRFNQRSSSRFGGRRSSDRLEKTNVICDSCKRRCEVPFKPTSNKPVYCSDCFKKDTGSKSNNYGKEFMEINQKLDKIMRILESE